MRWTAVYVFVWPEVGSRVCVCTQYSEPNAPHCVANAAYYIRTEYQSHFIQSFVLSSTSSNYEIIVSSIFAQNSPVNLDLIYWFVFSRSAWLRLLDRLPQNYIRKKKSTTFVCQSNFASLRSIINRFFNIFFLRMHVWSSDLVIHWTSIEHPDWKPVKCRAHFEMSKKVKLISNEFAATTVANDPHCIEFQITYSFVTFFFSFLFLPRADRSFLVANAQSDTFHIIFCSDGFCKMTGFTRAEVMQRSSTTEFLHGPMTSQLAVNLIKEALSKGFEKHFEILYYRKNGGYGQRCYSLFKVDGNFLIVSFWTGQKFLCSEVIAPIRSEVDDISLYIINFEDVTNPTTAEPLVPRLSKCKYGHAKLHKFNRCARYAITQ